jgi:hypothetical protein
VLTHSQATIVQRKSSSDDHTVVLGLVVLFESSNDLTSTKENQTESVLLLCTSMILEDDGYQCQMSDFLTPYQSIVRQGYAGYLEDDVDGSAANVHKAILKHENY